MTVLNLGVPFRMVGDVKVSFRGQGQARFRLEHTVDREGAPDEMYWFPVTRISDRSIAPEAAVDHEVTDIGKSGSVLPLVDLVQGDVDVVYRRYLHDWLRVVPGDDNEETEQACRTYTITAEPVTEGLA